MPTNDRLPGLLVDRGVYSDENGYRADFHSLRHTFCTRLQNTDVSERCAMELMRHSDRNLTNRVYTDSRLLPLDEAILKLSGFGKPVTQIHTQEFVSAVLCCHKRTNRCKRSTAWKVAKWLF